MYTDLREAEADWLEVSERRPEQHWVDSVSLISDSEDAG